MFLQLIFEFIYAMLLKAKKEEHVMVIIIQCGGKNKHLPITMSLEVL